MPDTHALLDAENAARTECAFERLQLLVAHGYRPQWNPADRAIHLEHTSRTFRDARIVLYPDGQLTSLASTDEFLILPHETAGFAAFLKTVPAVNITDTILRFFAKPQHH